ncbi:hypothetical protein TrVE_jg56 [Triparma verrucosa]|uniref:Uncharacterized protein n=1 Tax=Triparma verrucosa TaxID=1606542 RepID=A0A9W7BYZ9_9STRA|nr:hypothetical protein TrVE_jg56 [Triparma verrucosa]
MSSTPSLSSPTRSPYLKEKIKADAIHGAGLAFSLSQLMSELDALTLTESELKEELTSEIEAKRAMEERLRRANTPSAYSSYKDDASLDLTDDDTDENVVGGRESVASRGMLQRAESRNSIQSRGSVLTGGGQLKRQNSVRRKALRSFLWGSKSPEKTKEKKVSVAGKASKPVTTEPSVTKPSAPKPAVNAAPQVQEKAGLGSDSDSSSASILLSSDSDDSSNGVDSVRGDGGDGGESDVETEVESKAIGGGLEEDSVVTRSQDPAVTSKAVVEQTGGREHEQTDDLDDMIINESAEIAKLEKETVRLTQLLEVTKRDLEECKIGWKRSWARCEREIGELVLESQKK